MDSRSPILSLPDSVRDFGFYVDGRWIERGSRDHMERLSPGHNVPVTRIALCTKDDLDDAVQAARSAFKDRRWSGLSGAERAGVLLKAAVGIRERAEEIAYWETLETGKAISQARNEVVGAASI